MSIGGIGVPADHKAVPATQHIFDAPPAGVAGWALPSLSSSATRLGGGGKRLFMDATRIAQFQANCITYPIIASTGNLPGGGAFLNFNTGVDPFSVAFRYIRDGSINSTTLHNAVTTALADSYQIGPNYSASWCSLGADRGAFLLDWCYDALTSGDRTALINDIETRQVTRFAGTNYTSAFAYHEAHTHGFQAGIFGQLAIQGETGATDRLQLIVNMMQNWLAMQEEIYSDGVTRDYSYQDPFWIWPILAWEIATGVDLSANFPRNRGDAVARQLTNDAGWLCRMANDDSGIVPGAGWPAGTNNAVVISRHGATPNSLYATGGYYNFARDVYLGDAMAAANTQNWENSSLADGRWVGLAFKNPSLVGQSQSALGLPLMQNYNKEGLVVFRSGWSAYGASNRDVTVFCHFGSLSPHAMGVWPGHFEIFRGIDDLITSGGFYQTRLNAENNGGYLDLWADNSFAVNCLNFAPTGATSPDQQGGSGPAGDTSSGGFPVGGSAPLLGVYLRNNAINNSASWRGARINKADFNFVNSTGVVEGDCAFCFLNSGRPNNTGVTAYTRRIGWVSPNVVIINDKFTISSIDTIKSHFYSRVKPAISSPTTVASVPNWQATHAYGVGDVVTFASAKRAFQCRTAGTSGGTLPAGFATATDGQVISGDGGVTWIALWATSAAQVAAAGVYTSASQTFTVVHGNSQATVQQLLPLTTAANRIVGGPGFESYIDGLNVTWWDNNAGAGSGAVPDTWRIEYEMTAVQAGSQIVTIITIGANGDAIPSYTLAQAQAMLPGLFT